MDEKGQNYVTEKDVRESLFIDRRTGRMALNGQLVSERILEALYSQDVAVAAELVPTGVSYLWQVRADYDTIAESSDIPFGREKVITCYGIIGVLSLATSEYQLADTQNRERN